MKNIVSTIVHGQTLKIYISQLLHLQRINSNLFILRHVWQIIFSKLYPCNQNMTHTEYLLWIIMDSHNLIENFN